MFKKSKRQLGASLVEFGLLVALIAVVCIPIVKILGEKTTCKYDDSAAQLAGDPPKDCGDEQ